MTPFSSALRTGLLLAVASASSVPFARAEEVLGDGRLLPSLLLAPRGAVLAPGGRSARSIRGGLFIGVDAGAAFLLPESADRTQIDPTFGVRLGYEFANGLRLAGQYDDLMVAPSLTARDPGALQLFSLGIRYSLPMVVPMPYAEALAGAAVVPGGVTVGAGGGVGLTIPIMGRFFIDIGGRAILVPLEGVLRTVLTSEVGFRFSFASPGH